jgi:C4-dicarboxylate-specific signal transduction histidine kinase
VVLHRETTFFEKYFWAVMGAVAFFTLQSALIAYLIILNRRQSALSVRVRKAESRYRELLRIDRSARLGEMAGSLAHELNQPLTAILSSAQAALRFLKAGHTEPNQIREILEQIVGDDKRAASIINGVRNMLKKGSADRELVDVNDMVAEIAAVFQGEAINRHIRVETRFDRSLPPVMASKTQLQQVLLNLMINSAYAMAANPVDDRRLILATGTKGPNVVVSVRDVGPGIDPAHLDRMFEPFFTTRSEGMGMGLAVCRAIVDDHGGRIRAENHPDRGAAFTFELPAVENG